MMPNTNALLSGNLKASQLTGMQGFQGPKPIGSGLVTQQQVPQQQKSGSGNSNMRTRGSGVTAGQPMTAGGPGGVTAQPMSRALGQGASPLGKKMQGGPGQGALGMNTGPLMQGGPPGAQRYVTPRTGNGGINPGFSGVGRGLGEGMIYFACGDILSWIRLVQKVCAW